MFIVLFSLGSACEQQPGNKEGAMPPFSPLVNISPVLPTTSDTLQATILDSEFKDPDTPKDDLTLDLKWRKNGVVLDLSSNQSTIHAGLTERGQTWELEARVFDGSLYSKATKSTIVIQNEPPSVENAVASPTLPRTTDDLIIDHYDLRDSDDDPIEMAVRWLKNGFAFAHDGDGHHIHSQFTAKHDTWTVEITANDGIEDGDASVLTFSVANTPPLLESLTVVPLDLNRSSLATINLETHDADNDILSTEYKWFKNGMEIIGTDNQPLTAQHFVRGDEIQVEAIVWDGEESSARLLSGAVVVQNAPPDLSNVMIYPQHPKGHNNLSCVAMGDFDWDGDGLTSVINWFIDGLWVSNAAILSANSIEKNQLITCEMQVDDGIALSPTVSGSIEIQNSLPEIQQLDLTSPATSESILYCSPIGTDHDENDTVTFSYEWRVNGVTIPHGGSYLSSFFHVLSPEDEITCTAMPFDGQSHGLSVQSDTVVLLQPTVELSGQIRLGNMPIGGTTLNSIGLISLATESSPIDGSYSLETPTLSEGIASLSLPHESRPMEYVLGHSDDWVDFEVMASIFPEDSPDDSEPNDHLQTATPLLVNGALRHGTIHSDADEDYFEVYLSSGSYLLFSTHLHWATNLEMELLNSDGLIIDSNDSCLGKEACLMDVDIVQTGTYFIRILSQVEGLDRADYFIGAASWVDADGDGFSLLHDCNDSDPTIFIGSLEIQGDGIDQNCSGSDTPHAIGGDAMDPLDDTALGAINLPIINDMPEEWIHRADRSQLDMRMLYATPFGAVTDIDYFQFEQAAHNRLNLMADPSVSLLTQGCSVIATVLDDLQNTVAGPFELTHETVLSLDNSDQSAQQRLLKIEGNTPCVYRLLLQSAGHDFDGDGHYSQDDLGVRDTNDWNSTVQ